MDRVLVTGGVGFPETHVRRRSLAGSCQVSAEGHSVPSTAHEVYDPTRSGHFHVMGSGGIEDADDAAAVNPVPHSASPHFPHGHERSSVGMSGVAGAGWPRSPEHVHEGRTLPLRIERSDVRWPAVRSRPGGCSACADSAVPRGFRSGRAACHVEVLTSHRQALDGEPLLVAGDGSRTPCGSPVHDLVEDGLRLTPSGHTAPIDTGDPAEVGVLDLVRAVDGGREQVAVHAP
ncbi:hypothetical protein SAMN05660690_1223 [Geodermatophilus telluris]|uniref:Uncharacterized protein n=1 Tax=Geodermatophilus telluris TaxID=1190417 RepID=A0A1G6L6A0_9ACTN|nr:hypothetical protein SAMN05660690_1223 [Geodermatophilus telluris]